MALLQRPKLAEGSRLLERAYRLASHGRLFTSEGYPMALPLREFREALDAVGVVDQVACVIYLDALQQADHKELEYIRARIKK